MRRFSEWLARKWLREEQPKLAESYRVTFSTEHGRRVLQHMLDGVYCTVYEGKSTEELWMHNGRRAFVEEILVNIDLAEKPDTSRPAAETGGAYVY